MKNLIEVVDDKLRLTLSFKELGLEKYINIFFKNFNNEYFSRGMALGELIDFFHANSSDNINLSNVSHKINNIQSNIDIIDFEIQILDTPRGRKIKEIINCFGPSFLVLKPRISSFNNLIITFDFHLKNYE